ncbi:MAG: hypothetical protein JRI68_01925 [Deltaproteobacteria bacterium]|nr:hypothetical protein [Deltaproteobacteria bacterium]
MATTSIGNYRVTRTFAGEGDRHLARTDGGDRCQLRLLDLSSAADWEQAEREIAICQQLDEGGIGKTLEVFEHEGRLAVVSEALDGEPLDRLMEALTEEGQSLDPKAVWFIGHQVAGALALAHSASDADGDLVAVCHGYLSPEQIAIAWNGTVRLDGLGVAPLVGGAGSPGMTAYAAPEQASGGRVTPRGDSYSLAVVLWALLAGKIPEPGGADLDGLAEGVPEVVRTALATALEASLGKRRITSMEFEQWLGDVADPSGKGALATAMGVLRRGRLSGGAARGASDASGAPAAKRGKSSPERKYPPLRPRQPTLVGTAPGGGSEGGPTANLDWLKTGDGAETPSAAEESVDEITWGGDDDAEAILEPDDEEETLEVPVGPGPFTPPPAAGAAVEGAGRAGERLSEDDISEAMARADRVVEDLSALEVPPSTFDVRGGATDAGPAEDSVDELEDGQDPPELAAAVISSAPPPATRRSAPHEAPAPAKPVVGPGPPVPQAPATVSVEEGVVQLGAGPAGAPPTEPSGEVVPGLVTPREPASTSPLVTDSGSVGDRSPWTPDDEAAAAGADAPAPPRLSVATAILVTLATAVLTMVVGVWWVRHRATIAEPAAATASSPSAASSLASRRRAAPSGSASASATATSEASAVASGDPAAPPDDGKDGTALSPTKGYLVVTFSGDPHAEVFSAGQKLGPVNQKIEAPCLHPAFLRVGAPEAGGLVRWLTAGRPGVKIACQSVTKLTMAP